MRVAVVAGVVAASLGGQVVAAGAAPPTIGAQSVSEVTKLDATLHAEIDPNGLLTRYELQIDTTGNFKFHQHSGCPLEQVPGVGCTAEEVFGDPLAPGLVQPPEFTLPAGDEPQQVSVNMASIGATLQPGTTYYYRAIASSGLVLVKGATQTFTTRGGHPPGGPDVGAPGAPGTTALLPAGRRGRKAAKRCRRNQASRRGVQRADRKGGPVRKCPRRGLR